MLRLLIHAMAIFVLSGLPLLAGPAEAPELVDIQGKSHGRLAGGSNLDVLFFVTNDCPISNQYAPEMNRICSEFAGKGVRCFLVYVDPELDRAAVEDHIREYSLRIPAVADPTHELVELAGASVTPESALFAPGGQRLYRGRINNFYAALGKPRRHVTQHDLRDAIGAALAGKPVPKAETKAFGCYIPTLPDSEGK